jgi:DNA-binding winged helix-turn-helix (wHTH) protein
MHIARLRRALGDAGANVTVETRYGVGWRLAVDAKREGTANAAQRRRKDPANIDRDRGRRLRLAGR